MGNRPVTRRNYFTHNRVRERLAVERMFLWLGVMLTFAVLVVWIVFQDDAAVTKIHG